MSSVNGPHHNERMWWRSIDELGTAQGYGSNCVDEFSEGSGELVATGNDRRHFLKIMGASMALAGRRNTLFPTHIAPKAQCPEYQNITQVVLTSEAFRKACS